MVRVIIKGGVWRNTEDEILKAAIMKYGKNQWSRIASLLHRKSAKQCKARWFEWLDPGIKKTEWSRDEDEKLLHLAKLMPTQWRTIAPIVGRTAAQCLERYEHLLDEAQKRTDQVEEADDLSETRKLKVGEIDPTPETKPARPDPIDMDEDELEMLSEARARLANTQGKKAKRKAREKQLSEARRLASLQKRRELRAAGISWGGNKFVRRNPIHLDYNAEIPFEKSIPAGFYDPTEDIYENSSVFTKAFHAEIEGIRRDDVENEARKKDRETLKRRRADEIPETIFEEKSKKRRSKLILPTPQITDKEMEDIVKIGKSTEAVMEFSDSDPTSTLLHDYQSVHSNQAQPARTPVIYADALKKEAENLLALQNAPTPLKGGLNTPLHDLNSQRPRPEGRAAATPNTVLMAMNSSRSSVFEGTPKYGEPGTPATPFRDLLSINSPASSFANASALKEELMNLPKPRNDYEIIAPEETDMDTDAESSDWIEDASDIDARTAEEREAHRRMQLLKETEVIQRQLPVPSKFNESSIKPGAGKLDVNRADDLVKEEMLRLLQHDISGTPVEDLDLTDLTEASKLIEAELHPEERGKLNSTMWGVIDQCSAELILTQNKFTRLGVLSKRDQVDALSAKFQLYRDWMNNRAKQTAKIEKRLKVKLAGYQNISANTRKLLEEVDRDLDACNREKNTFLLLEAREERSIATRLLKLTEEVLKQEAREKELQALYAELNHHKWEIDQMFVRIKATIAVQPVSYK